jgi:hypothetical protein
MCLLSELKNGNVNMNHNEEVPDFLGGLGDMLPADVLKLVNELLEQLHRKEKDHQGSIVLNIYGKGSLHVDHVDTQNFYGDACPKTKTLPSPPCVGREKESSILPKVLATDEAMALWRKAQDAGYVDDNYQPLISRTQAALLADAIAVRLGIKEKWKVFESLWNRKYMRSDYNLALTRKGSLDFQDELKRLFG